MMKNVHYFVIFAFCAHMHGMNVSVNRITLDQFTYQAYEHLNALELKDALEHGTLKSYAPVDDSGNTLLHALAYNGEVEKLAILWGFFPILTKNKNNQTPLDLVAYQLVSNKISDNNLKQRLNACAALLSSANNLFITKQALKTIQQLQLDPSDTQYERIDGSVISLYTCCMLAKKAILLSNYEVYIALIDLGKNIKATVPNYQYMEICRLIESRNAELKKTTESVDCVTM